MSGYLHRLVHTVSHPRETVHPRTGSLFAPYRERARFALGMVRASGNGDNTSGTFGRHSTIDEPAETVQHPARSDASQSPLLPGTADEPPRTVESVQRADVPRPAGNEAQHDALEHAVQVPRPLVAPQAQRAVPDSRRARRRSKLCAADPPAAKRSAQHQAGDSAVLARSTCHQRGEREFRGRTAPTHAEREPDEIQIHIGRIEVTAVQPPAPRAPKPPDKAISLDAYLERRNGRAR